MKKRELEELLEEILKSRDIFKLFLDLKWPPSEVLEGIVALQHPDAGRVISAVAKRHRVGKDYLLQQVDRVLRQLREIKENNPYSVLGVPPDAPASEIREAWRHLVQRWHPDKNRDRLEEAQRRTRRYNEAYELLRDQRRRLEYDRSHLSLIMLLQGLDVSRISGGTGMTAGSAKKGAQASTSPASARPPKRKGGLLSRFLRLAVVVLCLASIAAWAGHYGVDLLMRYDHGAVSGIDSDDDLSVTPPLPVATPVTPQRGGDTRGGDRKTVASLGVEKKSQKPVSREMVALASPKNGVEIEFRPLVEQPREKKDKGAHSKGVEPVKHRGPEKEPVAHAVSGAVKKASGQAASAKKKKVVHASKERRGTSSSKPHVKKARRARPRHEEKVDESLLAIAIRELRSLVGRESSTPTHHVVKRADRPLAPRKGSAKPGSALSHGHKEGAKKGPVGDDRVVSKRERPIKAKKSESPKGTVAQSVKRGKREASIKHQEGMVHGNNAKAVENRGSLGSVQASLTSKNGSGPVPEAQKKGADGLKTPVVLPNKAKGVETTEKKTRGKPQPRAREEGPSAHQRYAYLTPKEEESKPYPTAHRAPSVGDEGRDIHTSTRATLLPDKQTGGPVAKGTVGQGESGRKAKATHLSLAEEQERLGKAFAWDLVERFVDAYRSGDIEKLSGLFSENAIDNGEKFKKLVPRYVYQFKTFEVQYYKVLNPQIVSLPDGQYLVKGLYQMALGVKDGNGLQKFSGPISWKICTTPKGLRICEVVSSVK